MLKYSSNKDLFLFFTALNSCSLLIISMVVKCRPGPKNNHLLSIKHSSHKLALLVIY